MISLWCVKLEGRKKKRPGLTRRARSPPAVKGKSHPGWGQSLTVTQTDSLACVSRSSATITAAQTWALLLQLTAWRLDRLLHVGKAERTLVGWTQVGVSEWTLWALPVQGYKRRRGHILNLAGLGMYEKVQRPNQAVLGTMSMSWESPTSHCQCSAAWHQGCFLLSDALLFLVFITPVLARCSWGLF